MTPTLLTIKDVAEMCSVSTKSVRRWIDAGLLDVVRCGPKLLRVEPAAVDRVLAGAKQAA